MLIKKNRIPVKHIATIGILPSFLKKFIYRLKGYKIDSGVKLSFGSVIIGKDVAVGKNTSIGFFTIIRARKIKINRFVKIGALSVIDTETLFIDDDARVNEQVYVGGMKTPESALIMGKRTIIMQASYINPTKPIAIGDDSGIGGHCLLFTHGSWNSQLEGYPVKFGAINIGKKVWLPWRVFVMPGVTIGDGAVIGADSLINKDVPANCLVAGSPVKIIKENFPQQISDKEKNEIIHSIFNDFENYLKHHGFSIERKNHETGFELLISNKGTLSLISFYETADSVKQSTVSDSILLLNNGELNQKKGYAMQASLQNSSRKGSSVAGEELITFLSRYGIRFNRLD